jgi:hypothetical protein
MMSGRCNIWLEDLDQHRQRFVKNTEILKIGILGRHPDDINSSFICSFTLNEIDEHLSSLLRREIDCYYNKKHNQCRHDQAQVRVIPTQDDNNQQQHSPMNYHEEEEEEMNHCLINVPSTIRDMEHDEEKEPESQSDSDVESNLVRVAISKPKPEPELDDTDTDIDAVLDAETDDESYLSFVNRTGEINGAHVARLKRKRLIVLPPLLVQRLVHYQETYPQSKHLIINFAHLPVEALQIEILLRISTPNMLDSITLMNFSNENLYGARSYFLSQIFDTMIYNKTLKKFILTHCCWDSTFDDLWKSLHRHPKIEELRLQCCDIDEYCLGLVLRSLPQLKTLEISCIQLSPSIRDIIAEETNIESLRYHSTHGCKFHDLGEASRYYNEHGNFWIPCLRNPHLKFLHVSRISKGFIRALAHNTTLLGLVHDVPLHWGPNLMWEVLHFNRTLGQYVCTYTQANGKLWILSPRRLRKGQITLPIPDLVMANQPLIQGMIRYKQKTRKMQRTCDQDHVNREKNVKLWSLFHSRLESNAQRLSAQVPSLLLVKAMQVSRDIGASLMNNIPDVYAFMNQNHNQFPLNLSYISRFSFKMAKFCLWGYTRFGESHIHVPSIEEQDIYAEKEITTIMMTADSPTIVDEPRRRQNRQPYRYRNRPKLDLSTLERCDETSLTTATAIADTHSSSKRIQTRTKRRTFFSGGDVYLKQRRHRLKNIHDLSFLFSHSSCWDDNQDKDTG